AAGETLTLTYTVKVDDGTANDTHDVVVTITGTNDAPTISVVGTDSDTSGLTESNVGLSDSGTLTAVDPDLSDQVTASVTGVVAAGTTAGLTPSGLTQQGWLTVTAGLIDADTGETNNVGWSFNSAGYNFDYLAAGETLTLTYTVKVDDGTANDTHDVVVTITGTNDAPTISVVGTDSDTSGLTE